MVTTSIPALSTGTPWPGDAGSWARTDHPDTLTSAHGLADDLYRLGEYQQARTLDEDTLARKRRVLGDDHLYTLNSADNLAHDLYRLGEYEQARTLGEDTLARRRRVMGEDHPHTRQSADNLALFLRRGAKLRSSGRRFQRLLVTVAQSNRCQRPTGHNWSSLQDQDRCGPARRRMIKINSAPVSRHTWA